MPPVYVCVIQLKDNVVSLSLTNLFLTLFFRYSHEGSASKQDSFELSLSDGPNKVTKTVTISVTLVNDQPSNGYNIHNNVEVNEGEKITFEPANLNAETIAQDAPRSYIVLQSPEYGQIQLEGHAASGFENYDLHKGLISYVHFGGEMGTNPMQDTATFAVFDLAIHTNRPDGR